MLRLRRSRVVLVLTVFAVVALYHFSSLGSAGGGGGFSVEPLINHGGKGSSSSSPTRDSTLSDAYTKGKESIVKEFTGKQPTLKEDTGDSTGADKSADKTSPRPKSADSSNRPHADGDTDISGSAGTPASNQKADVEEAKDLVNITKFNGEPAAVAHAPAEPVTDTVPDFHGQGRFEVIAAEDDGMPKIHWTRLPEHFPIPTKSLIPLPTGQVKAIPKIQSSKFPEESSDEKAAREAKLDKIKKTFAFSWDGYRKNAWMQDELSPVSGKFRNPFCGWAATLVDSLDSLWILGMKEEFEEATEAVGKIDFTTSIRNDLPLFEVTIRYLGGLIAAYDISESKYRILLDKAVELAEVLMGAFDTPNRMPMTFYLWKPTFASQPHRARTRVVLAELGSLTLEFTRLAQITKEIKYYDAIARITDEFERWQNHTKIPGLWPKQVDASGCKKPEPAPIARLDHSASKGPGYYNSQSPQIPSSGKSTAAKNEEDSTTKKVVTVEVPEVEASKVSREQANEKRQVSDSKPAVETAKPKPDCVPQGLNSPPGSGWEDFTIGGMADSVYEYLPKEYMLLGGLEEKYRTMYELAADSTKKNLIYRPMIEDEERNILVAGLVSTSGKSASSRDWTLKAEQTHLTCFAGGMFAVGARIFEREDDIDVAKRLTDGCVWAYEMTPTGIMPEHFLHVPCDDREKCAFNKTLWYEKLDPYHARRGSQSTPSQVVLDDKKVSSGETDSKTDKPGSKDHDAVSDSDSDPVATKPTADKNETSDSKLLKRQLGDIENDKKLQSHDEKEEDDPETASEESETTSDKSENESEAQSEKASHQKEKYAKEKPKSPEDSEPPTRTSTEEDSEPVPPVVASYTPPPIPSQEEYALGRIRNEKLPKGVMRITGSKYILRPEAIESVFIMYRVTGDEYWRKKGWNMFTSIQNATRAEFGASAISDVMSETPYPLDEMESFWLAETLKYFYLLFSEPDYYSLDDYVFYFEPANADLGNEELDDIVSAQCQTHGLIDDALRSYLAFTANYRDCLQSLGGSKPGRPFQPHTLIEFNQEDSPDTLHLIVALLLFDGREHEATFELMNAEGIFSTLVELIYGGKDDDAGLHRMLLELLYEMSRIQRLRIQDLILIEDDFIQYLFGIIEGLSDDVNDPYHYPTIRVL
ncbi:MAG: hypothetical protein Q9218_001943, partial [Villophora microphyllina]